ncbi:MAG: UvrD-helicase domain-containing protein [Acidimicrobiales bacterium]
MVDPSFSPGRMMASHPDLAAEQAHIDRAYESLDRTRIEATRLRSMVEVGKGGTEQARWEREMIEGNIANRLASLQLGDASLVFGRIDLTHRAGGDTFYIGRLAVADEHREPLVVDWRAPVAEPFYRATGRSPMGLVRRRHFATRGRQLLAIEDELFGEAAGLLGGELSIVDQGREIRGQSTLIAALEEARTGRLTDIVATIQGEQDEIIRADLPGVLVVQGGPGTGKTVVALHRAAYLLYTHRFPLEGQGLLVVGPNRLFLGYIEQVLPSLGEAGVELAVLADLLDHPGSLAIEGRDLPDTARVKGDLRMAKVLHKAVHDRQRPLRRTMRVGYGIQTLSLSVGQSRAIVADAKRRYHQHNAGRRHVEASVYATLADSARVPTEAHEVRERLRHAPEIRAALEWMWPVLTPADLLHDLFGSQALIDLASERRLTGYERKALYRKRAGSLVEVTWTVDDVPLLDEAEALLGPKPRRRKTVAHEDDVRTFGHIVVDEAQDLSPMQLRMLKRRSLNGSMTIVGDIAQSTGAWAHADWDEILEHLPDRRPPRREELTIGYRLPGPNMVLASKVLALAAPDLTPPSSVRENGDEPRFVGAAPGGLAAAAMEQALIERDSVSPGSVAVIVPDSALGPVAAAFEQAGVEFGRASRNGLNSQITIVPVSLVKGLELDASVVVEPAAILEEEVQGARALYVALTRATKRLVLVHERPLPEVLLDDG